MAAAVELDVLACAHCASLEIELNDLGSSISAGELSPIYWVLCAACLATGPTKETAREAIAAWNLRGKPPTPYTVIEIPA